MTVADFNTGGTQAEALTITTDDGAGAVNSIVTDTIAIAVTPVADIVDDVITTLEDNSASFNVLTGTSGATADTFEHPSAIVSSIGTGAGGPQNGMVTFDANGDLTYTPSPDFNGVDTFTYTVSTDDAGGTVTETATVTVNVTAVNDSPDARGNAYEAPEDTTVTGNVIVDDTSATPGSETGTDSDAETAASALVVSSFTIAGFPGPNPDNSWPADTSAIASGFGTLTINSDGSFTLVPESDFNGAFPAVTYTVDDGSGELNATDSAPLLLTITPVNDAPNAINDNNVGVEDAGDVTGDVIANDTDIDGDALLVDTFTIAGIPGTFTAGDTATIPGVGSINLLPSGAYTFTPNVDYNSVTGPAFPTLTYTVTDGNLSDTATLNIAITPVNDAPDAVNDTVTGVEDAGDVTGDVLANDLDVDGNAFFVDTFTIAGIPGTFIAGDTATIPGIGTINLLPSGAYTFTPDANYNSIQGAPFPTLTYTITDGALTDTAALDITITTVNDAPTSFAPNQTTNEDTDVSGTVTLDDPDLPGGPDVLEAFLDPSLASQPQNGIVTVNPDGTYTYSPDPEFNGIDTFTVLVIDNQGAQTTTTITITVLPVNDAPIATNEAIVAQEDVPTPLAPTLPIDLDDAQNVLSVQVTQIPQASQGDLFYTLDAGGTAQVTLASVLSVNELSSVFFQSAPNYNGPVDTFTYIVSDDEGLNDAGSQGSVAISILPVNDIPTAIDNTNTVNEDGTVSGNVITDNSGAGVDSDPDGDVLNLSSVVVDIDGDGVVESIAFGTNTTISNLAGDPIGDINFAVDGSYTFAPAPEYIGFVPTIGYTIEDGNGERASASLIITIIPVNDAPNASNDAVNVDEDVATALNPTLPVDIDDAQVDISVLVTQTPQPTQGVLNYTLDSGGTAQMTTGLTMSLSELSSVLFTPVANYNGPVDLFTYTAIDDEGASDAGSMGSVTINLVAVNDNPVAVDDAQAIAEDTVANGNVITDIAGADSDIDGDALTVVSATIDQNGDGIVQPMVIGVPTPILDATNTPVATVTLMADGSYSVTPSQDFNGTIPVINYTIDDGNGGTANANLTITVLPVNDAPDAGNDTIFVDEDIDTLLAPTLPTDVDDAQSALSVTVNQIPQAAQGVLNYDLDGGGRASVSVGTVLSVTELGTVSFQTAANYNGPVDSFIFSAQDDEGATDAGSVGTVAIIVNPLNDTPTATDNAYTVDEDDSVAGNAILDDTGTGVDSDPEGDLLSISSATVDLDGDGLPDALTLSAPATIVNGAGDTVGDLTLNADGSFLFTPAENYNGPVPTVNYTITDGNSGTASAVLTFTIIPVNDAPDASNDAVTADEDVATPLNPTLPTDVDDVQTALTVLVTQVPQVSQGSLSYTQDAGGTANVTNGIALSVSELSSVSFLSAPNYNGPVDTFRYLVADDQGDSTSSDLGSIGSVSITLVAINDAPDAVNDGLFTPVEDQVTTGNVLGNDSDPDGDTITVVEFSVAGVAGTTPADGQAIIPNVGTLSIATNGDFTFTPDLNYVGPVPAATYTITDNVTGTDSALLVFLDVVGNNDAPEARNNSYSTPEETQVTGNILLDDTGSGVDSDADGDALSVSAYSIIGQVGPFNVSVPYIIAGVGEFTLQSNGTFTFDPATDFNGAIPLITYTVDDGNGGSDDAVLNIDVTPLNDLPTAIATPGITVEDQAVSGSIIIADVDGDVPVASLNGNPSNGSVTVNPDGTWSYTPLPDFNGVDQFEILVDDTKGGLIPVTVNVTVTPLVDIADDQIETAEDTATTVNVIDGTGTVGGTSGPGVDDFEATPVVTGVTQGSNGSVTFFANGDITYTPNADFNGTDVFTYSVTSGRVTETATVTVNVTPVNDAPIGIAPPAVTLEEAPVSGTVIMSDPDGDVPTARIGISPLDGTAVVNPDGTWTYIPVADFEGTDSFTVIIDDGNGGTSFALVNVTVIGVNDAPDATPSSVLAITEIPTPLNITLPTDVDDDDSVLRSIILQTPSSAQGILTYVSDASPGITAPLTSGLVLSNTELATGEFTSAPGFSGMTNSLIFRAADDQGASDAGSEAVISIDVTTTPMVTEATEPPQTTDEDTPFNGTIDIVASLPTTTTLTSQASNGTVLITDPATGAYVYTPNPDFNGVDQFTVIVRDGVNPDVTVVVDVTVNPVNDPVTVVVPISTLNLQDGETVNADASALFNDVDSPITFTSTPLPAGVTLDPVTGILSGTLLSDASQSAPFSVTITASDGVNPPVNAVVDIEVTNPPPTIIADIEQPVREGESVVVNTADNVVDPDGDPLSWTSPNLPVWLALDPLAGQITGTTPSGLASGVPIVFTVWADDGQGGTVTITVTLIPEVVDNVEPIFPGVPTFVEVDIPETRDQNDVTTPVQPFVNEAINSIADLNGTKKVDGEKGIVHDAVSGIQDIDSTENAEPVDPAVLEAVNAIEALRQVHLENGGAREDGFNDWEVEGLTGFSLKFGTTEDIADGDGSDEAIGKLIIETYVRERILFIDVSNTFDPEVQGTVERYKVEMIDGSPVPDWIRIVRDGFIVAERPANLWDLNLKISAEMSDGNVISRGVEIDGPTGEIQPVELASEDRGKLFADQLRSLAGTSEWQLREAPEQTEDDQPDEDIGEREA